MMILLHFTCPICDFEFDAEVDGIDWDQDLAIVNCELCGTEINGSEGIVV
jgi:transcription elongation factor Elf1